MVKLPELPEGAAIPVPVRVTDCEEFTVRVADAAPTADGVKVTLIEQLVFAARLAEQVLVSAKALALAPETLMLLMASAELEELLTVTVWVTLVIPTC